MMPITSDLAGYEQFWARWLTIGLSVIGVGFVILSLLLLLIWRK